MGLGSLGQNCLNRCTIKLSLLKHENKWPHGGLLSTQQLPQSTTSLIFSYHRPFVMISTTKAEICTNPAAVFHTHSCTHWPRSSAVEETPRSRSPQSSAAIPTRPGADCRELSRAALAWGQAFSNCLRIQVRPLHCWEGICIGLSVLPWEVPGRGIVSCAFLSLLYIFGWLNRAKVRDGAEHLVCFAWWLHMVLGSTKISELSLKVVGFVPKRMSLLDEGKNRRPTG